MKKRNIQEVLNRVLKFGGFSIDDGIISKDGVPIDSTVLENSVQVINDNVFDCHYKLNFVSDGEQFECVCLRGYTDRVINRVSGIFDKQSEFGPFGRIIFEFDSNDLSIVDVEAWVTEGDKKWHCTFSNNVCNITDYCGNEYKFIINENERLADGAIMRFEGTLVSEMTPEEQDLIGEVLDNVDKAFPGAKEDILEAFPGFKKNHVK